MLLRTFLMSLHLGIFIHQLSHQTLTIPLILAATPKTHRHLKTFSPTFPYPLRISVSGSDLLGIRHPLPMNPHLHPTHHMISSTHLLSYRRLWLRVASWMTRFLLNSPLLPPSQGWQRVMPILHHLLCLILTATIQSLQTIKLTLRSLDSRNPHWTRISLGLAPVLSCTQCRNLLCSCRRSLTCPELLYSWTQRPRMFVQL